ncbi:hypothetical protein [Prosthecobacter sp.]|uniref:hypothetical protein n=1 Tax=Prosthecobacter sp. TaxID=1965333 RepID=UPI0037833CC5
MPNQILSLKWCSAIVALGLAAAVEGRAQDTIQIGPLKPLQTLPSLGPAIPPTSVLPKSGLPGGLVPPAGQPPAAAASPQLPGAAPSAGMVPPPTITSGSTLTPGATLGAGGTLTTPPTLTPGAALTPPVNLTPGSTVMPGSAALPGSALTPPPTLTPGSTLAPASPLTPASVPTPPPATSASAPAAPPPLPTSSSVVITGPIAQTYLYIEPYQTRFEALFDAASVLAWLSPDVPLPESLTPEQQKQISEKVAAQAGDWCSLSTGDQALAVPQPLVTVIKGLPGNTLPMKEGETLALNQALVGLMWEFATPPGPDELNVTWKGWFKGISKLPVRVFFGPQTETGEIHAAIKNYRWRNLGRMTRPAPLVAVPQITRPAPVRVPMGGIVWVLGGLVFYIYLKIKDHKLPGGSLPYFAVWLLGGVLMSQLLIVPYHPKSATPTVTQVAEAQQIVSPLLRNVYRAFDHHVESDVYDVLARSVDGELLRKLYLETIQALTLDGREGTRVTIAEFAVTVDKVEKNPQGPGFVADCNWNARGIVGHWGHSHPRVNIYNARVTITPVKDEWKLTGLEVQEVRRL